MTSIVTAVIPLKGGFLGWISLCWFMGLAVLGGVGSVFSQPPARPNLFPPGQSDPSAQSDGKSSSPAAEAQGAENGSGSGVELYAPSPASPAIPTPGSELDPAAVLRRAIWQAVWGEPISCRVRQRIEMFDKELVGVGSYDQAGQGSGKLKWQMRLAAADAVTNYLQISDGRLFWTSHQVEEEIKLNRVDLGKIRERIGPVRQSDLSNPLLAIELAIGGQAEMLRNLYHRYQWESAVPTKLDQQPIWLLTGQIRQTAPIPAGRAPIDQTMVNASQTGLLPQRVRLSLGRTEQFPFFPYRIEYFRQKADSQDVEWETITVVEFFEVSKPTVMEPELFQYEVRDSVEVIGDDTMNYLPASSLHLTKQPSKPRR